MKKTIALGLVAVSLGACDKIPFLNGPASPQRKAGLWEQSIQSDQSATPMVSQACYDAASDKRMPVLRGSRLLAGVASATSSASPRTARTM